MVFPLPDSGGNVLAMEKKNKKRKPDQAIILYLASHLINWLGHLKINPPSPHPASS